MRLDLYIHKGTVVAERANYNNIVRGFYFKNSIDCLKIVQAFTLTWYEHYHLFLL